MPLQQVPRFYIPLQSTYCLFVAYFHEFRNRELYDGFVLPVFFYYLLSYLFIVDLNYYILS